MKKDLPKDPQEYLKGQLLLVNKPLRWTSFDVVNKLRYALKKRLNLKKIKVGHSGTLDPLATGLLLIATGKFTKKLEDLTGLPKQYEGTIKFGESTPSYDAETEANETFPTTHITETLIEEKLVQFRGQIEQIPPMFSAIKVGGEALYKKARKGEMVEVKARKLEISKFELISYKAPNMDFIVDCSKGTYIRSLANDLGKACESGAYLTRLKRNSIGDFHIDGAYEVEDLVKIIYPAYINTRDLKPNKKF